MLNTMVYNLKLKILKIMKNNKYLLLFVLFFIIIFCFTNSAFAAMEVPLPGLGENPSLKEYITYIFNTLIILAGLLSVISFAAGGISLIASGDSSEMASNAKDRMKGAALGLGLTMISFIILQTINPRFVQLYLQTVSGGSGVFLVNDDGINKTCPGFVDDIKTLPEGFNKIKYVCSAEEQTNDSKILVTLFDETGREKGNGDLSSGINTTEVSCDGEIGIGSGSFSWQYLSEGVYLYLDSGCSGYTSGPVRNSKNNLGYPFSGKAKGAKIVNNDKTKSYYGAIFHQKMGLEQGGNCTLPITSEGCQSINLGTDGPFAADIFKYRNSEETLSGNGVTFFSEPFGWNSGANAGYYIVKANEIKHNDPFSSDTAFLWDKTNRTGAYKTACANFKLCPGSIDIAGDYLVAVYSSSDTYCQTFTKNVNNSRAEPVVAIGMGGGDSLGNIYIIPTIGSTGGGNN